MPYEQTPLDSRRRFLGAGAGLASAAALGAMIALPSGRADAQALAAGQGYQPISPPMPTRDADRVEVLEFFWFGCPHCYAFEPAINGWAERKPDYVDFVREAPPLNPSWEPHSRAFYAAEALGISDGFFDTMFDTIHKGRKPMRKASAIGAFVESLDLGVDAETFEKTMQSFSVETALRRSVQLARTAGITGVPSVVINGKYLTGNSLAGGTPGVIAVIERLVVEEHAA